MIIIMLEIKDLKMILLLIVILIANCKGKSLKEENKLLTSPEEAFTHNLSNIKQITRNPLNNTDNSNLRNNNITTNKAIKDETANEINNTTLSWVIKSLPVVQNLAQQKVQHDVLKDVKQNVQKKVQHVTQPTLKDTFLKNVQLNVKSDAQPSVQYTERNSAQSNIIKDVQPNVPRNVENTPKNSLQFNRKNLLQNDLQLIFERNISHNAHNNLQDNKQEIVNNNVHPFLQQKVDRIKQNNEHYNVQPVKALVSESDSVSVDNSLEQHHGQHNVQHLKHHKVKHSVEFDEKQNHQANFENYILRRLYDNIQHTEQPVAQSIVQPVVQSVIQQVHNTSEISYDETQMVSLMSPTKELNLSQIIDVSSTKNQLIKTLQIPTNTQKNESNMNLQASYEITSVSTLGFTQKLIVNSKTNLQITNNSSPLLNRVSIPKTVYDLKLPIKNKFFKSINNNLVKFDWTKEREDTEDVEMVKWMDDYQYDDHFNQTKDVKVDGNPSATNNCPPLPLQIHPTVCSAASCLSDKQCQRLEKRKDEKLICCFNGCKKTCTNAVPPVPFVDWEKIPQGEIFKDWFSMNENRVNWCSPMETYYPDEEPLLCPHGYFCKTLDGGKRGICTLNRNR